MVSNILNLLLYCKLQSVQTHRRHGYSVLRGSKPKWSSFWVSPEVSYNCQLIKIRAKCGKSIDNFFWICQYMLALVFPLKNKSDFNIFLTCDWFAMSLPPIKHFKLPKQSMKNTNIHILTAAVENIPRCWIKMWHLISEICPSFDHKRTL